MAPSKKTFVHSESEDPSHSPVYRNHTLKDGGELLVTLPGNVTTLYESLQNSIKTYGNNVCFGSRRVLKTVQEAKEIQKKVDGEIVKENKTWDFFQLSPYEWISYSELGVLLNKIGSGLKHIGLGGEKRLALFAPTSHYWSTMANACYTQNISAITVYDTLGAAGLKHGLNECEIPAIFTTPQQIETIQEILSEVPTLQSIIHTETLEASRIESLKAIRPELSIYSFEEFLKLGEEHPSEHNPPKPEDVCLIMYTSGTTGNPKGVVITHRNVVSIVAGARSLVSSYFIKSDVYLSFLPLAHILAFAVDCLFLSLGVCIAYGNPRTLSDVSVRECKGDLREARPTIVVGVPQVFDLIRKGILNKINGSGPVAQNVFNVSLRLKRNFNRFGLPTFLLDALVFKKIKDQMGGRLRYAVSGGAPLSEATQTFFSTAVCNLFQGYGLTEVCGIAVACTPDMFRPTNIGKISPSLEFKLVDVPEMGYLHTNSPPQGELWFRGPPVAKGYYKNDAATAEAFTEDGWFKTGDIVTYHDNGSLSIVDRKKNLAKLSNGEYIAVERLESRYKNVLYVQNICVVVNSEKNRPVALVQVNLDAVNHFAKAANMPEFHDLNDISKSEPIRKEVLSGLQAEAKNAKFSTSETVIDVFVSPIEWSADNELLTTSQKLRRKPLSDKFQAELTAMFNKF